MAVGDLYELTDVQTFQGQLVVNVYYYHQELEFVPGPPTRAQVLAENWVTQKLPSVTGCQAGDVTHTSVSVRNLFDPGDQFEKLISVTGNYAGGGNQETLPAFNALSFTLSGDNAAVRSGKKRLAGIPEPTQSDGVIVDPGFVANGAALSAALAGYVTVGAVIQDNVFAPVVIKRVRTGTPGNYQYRLPQTSAEAVISRIAAAAFDLLVTSQLSRKIGVGR